MTQQIRIDPATPADVPMIRTLIRELAEFERLLHEANATDEQIHESLFGPKPGAEVIMARVDDEVAGFALFFHNFSTFLGRRGLYLEDLFVRPSFRGGGCGGALLRHLAKLAVERNCGRFEWSVLDWNSEQSTSIRIWAPYRWTSGRSIALPVRHWKSSRTANPN